jgi:hypothetical protein
MSIHGDVLTPWNLLLIDPIAHTVIVKADNIPLYWHFFTAYAGVFLVIFEIENGAYLCLHLFLNMHFIFFSGDYNVLFLMDIWL